LAEIWYVVSSKKRGRRGNAMQESKREMGKARECSFGDRVRE